MCYHLTICVPAEAVLELPRLMPAGVQANTELHKDVAAAIGSRGECFNVGAPCACPLYHTDLEPGERLRRKAQREKWSQAKLARALKQQKPGWTGLLPELCESLATVAERWGQILIFLFWDGKGGRSDIHDELTVLPNELRQETALIKENRLLIVKGG